MNEPATPDATSGGAPARAAASEQSSADVNATSAARPEHTTTGSAPPRSEGSSKSGRAGEAGDESTPSGSGGARQPRRRRGGRGRGRSGSAGGQGPSLEGQTAAGKGGSDTHLVGHADEPDEMPKPSRQGRPSGADAEASLVRTPSAERAGRPGTAANRADGPGAESPDAESPGTRSPRAERPVSDGEATSAKPRIGDTRPARSPGTKAAAAESGGDGAAAEDGTSSGPRKRRRRGGRGRSSGKAPAKVAQGREPEGVRSGVARPVTALTGGAAVELDDEVLEERRGRTRNGKPVGRYLMAVHAGPEATQISILEGRSLIEHYVARPSDDIHQIHGNIYLGRVQNVLPGMEAAFIDIGTPKNAVLYRGDVHYDAEDIEERDDARIEHLLQPRQTLLCQVTKNPIMHKGARLTQEVSLPGRFVVFVPNSRTLGISKRLPDDERKRLRKIVDRVRPEGHGVIVRTAAESITAPEIERDLARLVAQWEKIEALARKASAPALLYREPDMALRVIREEFSRDFRSVAIDDKAIFDDVQDYVASVSPALAERVTYYDPATEPLALFERHRIVEQLGRALDRKVWLPSGGSLIIEHTEALTVIDVNTGKNVGKSNLEDTVFENNLEAAVEIARQLRLRDIGGIIVIDFVDMEVRKNRAEVVRVFREALARDKTRTQVFEISELGLVQMTRKRIGEGLLESFSEPCSTCEGRGVVFDRALLAP